ncbi:MAG: NAD(P)/FAD-dependent oxidoreductase [Sulfurovaceae bacterium]|nr:NAD(P)/FAD-dependent oxidoreductase [Sulfurovaceae bacterium]MDD5549158.1 NAD(P)/FAD-dependent oxidoreductase [Sulfurovaceae bacterium]
MNNKKTKIAIIGAGASGMMCAITAKKQSNDLDITIFEKNDKVGKKILASGNGRCNIINTTFDETNYHTGDSLFVQKVFEHFSFSTFKKFCLDIGLVLDVKEDGKCYPLSNEARSVVTLFSKALSEQGVQLRLGHEVGQIRYEKDAFFVDDERFDKLVISSGLGAASQLGSSEDGLEFARSLGHDIVPTFPALVGLEFGGNAHKELFGVKIRAKVSLYVDGDLNEEVLDDILFTNYGISGFAILDISTSASYALSLGSRVFIEIDLLPQFDRNKLFTLLKQVDNELAGILPLKLIKLVKSQSIKETTHNIQHLRFDVSATHGFDHAEASGGGILTSGINPHTMESKKISNLYFTGEVLDVVGQRGGYNFAFAWASGYNAGKSLAED